MEESSYRSREELKKSSLKKVKRHEVWLSLRDIRSFDLQTNLNETKGTEESERESRVEIELRRARVSERRLTQ